MDTKLGYYKAKAREVFNKRIKIADKVEKVLNLSSVDFRVWQMDSLFNSVIYAYQNSKFYKNKYAGLGFDINKISSIEEFKNIPFTERTEIQKNYPFGLLAAPMADIVRYGESTGTTSSPIGAYFTAEDWVENNCTVAFFLEKILSSHDIAAVAVPYELAFVGQDLDRALEIINCTTIAIGALTHICPPERMIQIFKDAGVTTLICSATRAIYLADTAIKLGYDLKKDFKIRKILCVGEGITKAKEKILQNIWNAEVYSMYGMTETNTLGMFCIKHKLHLVENRSFFEIIDPVSGEEKKGIHTGELVVTSLNTKGIPLIRYRTGDYVKVETETCSCGSPFKAIQHFGRLEDYIKIKDTKVYILQIEEDILDISGSIYYTLTPEADYLKIGLVISDELCKQAELKLTEVFLKKYGFYVKVFSVNKDKIEEIIRNSLKPNIKSVLIANNK